MGAALRESSEVPDLREDSCESPRSVTLGGASDRESDWDSEDERALFQRSGRRVSDRSAEGALDREAASLNKGPSATPERQRSPRARPGERAPGQPEGGQPPVRPAAADAGGSKARSPSRGGLRLELPSGEGLTPGELGAALLTAVINGKTPHALKLSQIIMSPQLSMRGGPQVDLMPLPLPRLSKSEEEYAWKGAVAWETLEYHEREAWQHKAWMIRGIHTMNELYLGRHRPLSEEMAQCIRRQEPHAAQRKALRLHAEYVTQFLESARRDAAPLCSLTVPTLDWAEDLKRVARN